MISFKLLLEQSKILQHMVDKFHKIFGINGILFKGKLYVHRGAFKVGNEIIFKDLHPQKGEKVFNVQAYGRNGIKIGKFKIYMASSIIEITNFFEEIQSFYTFLRVLKSKLGANVSGPLMKSVKTWYLLESLLEEKKVISTKDCILTLNFIDKYRFRVNIRNRFYSVDYFFEVNQRTKRLEDVKAISMNITTSLFTKRNLKPFLGGILLVCM